MRVVERQAHDVSRAGQTVIRVFSIVCEPSDALRGTMEHRLKGRYYVSIANIGRQPMALPGLGPK